MAIIEDMPDEIAGDVWNVQVHGPDDDGRWFVQGPLLGDVPVLGHLFRSESKVSNRRELLVFVTPRIVSDALTLR